MPTRKHGQGQLIANIPVLCSVLSGVCIVIEIFMFTQPERPQLAQITCVVEVVNPPHRCNKYTAIFGS